EAYLLARLVKDVAPEGKLYLGWVPVVGADDRYPKDSKGRPIEPVKFTIRAEKCPNRRGVEEVLRHYQKEVLPFDRAVEDAAAGRLQALYLTAGYPPKMGTWYTPEQMEAFRKVPLLVVQDLQPSPISEVAKYMLPASSFAEKDGCFVNHANLAQQLRWAVRPGHLGRTDGQIFLDLLGRRGLLQAKALRQELAREVPYFAALAAGDLGEFGVKLV